jgi:rod shape-determining protein MreC
VRLAADYQRLDFLRVLRSHAGQVVEDVGALVVMNPVLAPVAEGVPAGDPDGVADGEVGQ